MRLVNSYACLIRGPFNNVVSTITFIQALTDVHKCRSSGLGNRFSSIEHDGIDVWNSRSLRYCYNEWTLPSEHFSGRSVSGK